MPTDASGPEMELLRTFAVFAEQGEVKLTARTLGIDESAISRRLKDLQTGPHALLKKQGNALVLTDKGRQLLPAVRRLIREHEQFVGRLRDHNPFARSLRVAGGGGLAFTPLPAAVTAFRGQHSDVQVRVLGCRWRDRIRGVAGGEFDLALVSHDAGQVRAVAGEHADLRCEVLREQPVLAVAAAASADGRTLAALPPGVPVPSAVLATLTLLGLDEKSGVRRQLDAEFRAANIDVPKGYAVYPGGWEAARAFARHGLGTAILPMALADPTDSELVCRPVLPTFRLTDRVVWPATADPLTAAFVDCLTAAFA